MSTLDDVLRSMAYNYFFNSWLYRLEVEGPAVVEKDSREAADKFVIQYREQVERDLLHKQAKARQEKLNAAEEAVIVS